MVYQAQFPWHALPSLRAHKPPPPPIAGEPGDAELSPAELLVQAKLRIESLERQLVWREEKLQAALSAQRELKEQVAQYHEDFEREKTEIFDISADMTRQCAGLVAKAG